MSRGALRAMFRPYVEFDFTRMAFDTRVSFSRSSTGTYFDAAGVMQNAASNVPRKGHNPATGAVRGLLAEEQRTNDICKYIPAAVSGKFEWWGSAPESVRYVASPDGATDGVVPKPIAFNRRWQFAFPAGSLANGSAHSVSWHEKQVPPTGGTGQVIGLRSWVGVSPSAITSTPSGSGYARKSVVATVTNNASDMIFRFYLDGPSGSDDLAAWGWQFEPNVTTPSSYIHAAGASVTRSADVATFTIPPRVVRLVTIYDDGTTSQQDVTPGASYTIPIGQKPILRIRGYFA